MPLDPTTGSRRRVTRTRKRRAVRPDDRPTPRPTPVVRATPQPSPDVRDRNENARVRNDPELRTKFVRRALASRSPDVEREKEILGEGLAFELDRSRRRLQTHVRNVVERRVSMRKFETEQEREEDDFDPLSIRDVAGRAVSTNQRAFEAIGMGGAAHPIRQAKHIGGQFAQIGETGQPLEPLKADVAEDPGLPWGAAPVRAAKPALELIEGGAKALGIVSKPAQRAPRVQSQLYYRNVLQEVGASPEVLSAIPYRPKFEHLVAAGGVAQRVGDQKAVDILRDELAHLMRVGGGSGKRFARLRETRTVKVGDLSIQFPNSPALVTAAGQRAFDRFTRYLSRKISPDAPRVLQGVTSRMRGAKMQGTWRRRDIGREQAKYAEQKRTLRTVGSRFGLKHLPKREGHELAHYWYAQLPSEFRNAKGLSLLRDKLADEYEFYTSGRAMDEFQAQRESLADAMREAGRIGDTNALWDAKNALDDIDEIIADYPARIDDIAEEIRKLNYVVKNPVEVDDDVIRSIDELMRAREENLVEAGLDPNMAAERRGLVSRWLGLEETGEEIFVGHRLPKELKRGQSPLPGTGLGKTRLPTGTLQANRLILARLGRVRQSMESIVDDFSASEAYKFANIVKDDLWKMAGDEGRIVGRPKPGYVVINPHGHTLPRRWKIDDELRSFEEGLSPEKFAETDLPEYTGKLWAEAGTPEADELMRAAMEAGNLDDLRQIPEDMVHRYFGQFRDPRISIGIPGLRQTGLRRTGKVLDVINDALYTSLIYSNPGYLPANSVANLLMAGAHQGAFLPFNLIRAGQVMTQAPKHLRNLLTEEIAHGASRAASSETVLTRGLAAASTKLADNPYRLSSLLHEAAREKIIKKVGLYLDDEDYRALENLLTNEQYRPLLNDIRDRANQAMVDFERLGPHERVVARRLLFVWTWMRGGSRYPFRFALDHPLRSALTAYVVAGAPGAPEEVQERVQGALPNVAEGMPPWLAGALEADEWPVVGGEGRVMPTRSISPVSTPYDVISSALARPGAQTFGEFLNPGFRTAYQLANRQTPFGRETTYTESAKQHGERLAPQFGLTKDLISPPDEGGLYPEDTSRLGRFKRATRVVPYEVDRDEAYKARMREGMVDEDERLKHELKTFVEESREAGMGDPPEEAIEDLRWRTRLFRSLKRDSPYSEDVKVAAALFDERYDTQHMSERARSVRTEGQAEALYDDILKHLSRRYNVWNRVLERRQDLEIERAEVSG